MLMICTLNQTNFARIACNIIQGFGKNLPAAASHGNPAFGTLKQCSMTKSRDIMNIWKFIFCCSKTSCCIISKTQQQAVFICCANIPMRNRIKQSLWRHYTITFICDRNAHAGLIGPPLQLIQRMCTPSGDKSERIVINMKNAVALTLGENPLI